VLLYRVLGINNAARHLIIVAQSVDFTLGFWLPMQIDVIAAGAFPVAGRRRVSQLSKDQWRESLQQQLREKEELKNAQAQAKLSASEPTEVNNQRSEHGESPAPSGTQQREYVDAAAAAVIGRSGGRRLVRAMTADEWKASLEEQLREKERQRQTRGQTAPTDTRASESPAPKYSVATTGEATAPSAVPVSTLPLASDDDTVRITGGRRRGVQPQQTREEYLKGLQEQIELKKVLVDGFPPPRLDAS
jgi:hypothetical protein